MQENRQAMAIRFEEFPHGRAATRAIDEISVDYRSVLDNERVAMIVLPGDTEAVRHRLEESGFAIAGVDSVSLSEHEAWFLTETDVDDFDLIGDDDELEMDFDFIDGAEIGAGPRF